MQQKYGKSENFQEKIRTNSLKLEFSKALE